MPLESNGGSAVDVRGKCDVIASGGILINQLRVEYRRVTHIDTDRLAGYLPEGVAYIDLIPPAWLSAALAIVWVEPLVSVMEFPSCVQA